MTGIHERYLKNPVTRDLDKIFNKLYILFVLFNFLIGG